MLLSHSSQVLYGVNQRLRVEDVDSPLCEIRPVKSVLLVVLTGDRGLCGGYNNFIIKRVRAEGALMAQLSVCCLGWDNTASGQQGGWQEERQTDTSCVVEV